MILVNCKGYDWFRLNRSNINYSLNYLKMKANILLVQYNNLKERKVTFEASKKVTLEDKSKFDNVAKQISEFCKEAIEFSKRSKARGINISMLKKTQPIDIVFESGKKDIIISFKNFGKFVEESSKSTLKSQIKDSFQFLDKFSNWEK